MTDEERRIITSFVERVSGAAGAAQARPASPWGTLGRGAQPAQPPLPPVDPEADRLIAELFDRYPEARYRLTQTAFVQEAALVEMQNRVQQMEWELENARRQGQASQNRGMLGGLFGGGGRPAPMPPRPQPQYPPGHNPAMLQGGRGGSGFLGTALMTAAGVAGGLVLGNAIMGALSGGAAEAATAEGDFAQDAVPASSPWTDPASATEQPMDDAQAYDQGGYGADDAGAYDDGGGFDEEI
jgi:hypothetical protein